MEVILLYKKRKKLNVIYFSVFSIILIVAFITSLLVGRYKISLSDFGNMLISKDGYETEKSIVVNLRLPRTLLALLTGMALSVSGILYQDTFQNKLVSPDLLGVSSGAGVGAAIAILLGLSSMFVSTLAFLFGVLTVLATLFVSKAFQNKSSVMLTLSGIIVGGCMSAVLSLIKYLADAETTLSSITFWLMGSFEQATMQDVYILFPIVLICCTIIFVIRWRINIVALGREEAQTKGINYDAYRLLIIVVATMLTASSVSFAGTISWIGLVIPHIVRLIVGRDSSVTLPMSMLLGSIFMIFADILSRTFTASEIPLSAITGLFGTVIFVIILFVRRSTIHENY